MQIQREREKLMTPKLRGIRASLDKVRHALESDADKLAARLENVDARRKAVFEATNGAVDSVERDIKEVEELITDMERGNGAPLDDFGEQSNVVAHPRSSEVASR